MPDDLPSDVLAAALKEEPSGLGLEDATRAIIPLADRVRLTLADIHLIPLAKATPQQRTEIVKLRAEINRVARDAATWVDAIDISFRHAAVELGNVREIPLADGIIKVDWPRDDVKVDAGALKKELEELSRAGGPISLEEIADIFTTVVEVRANNTKLNYFERNRGEAVAEVIQRHRTRTPGSAMGSKLSFVERA